MLVLGFFAEEIDPGRLAKALTQSADLTVRRAAEGPDWLSVDNSNRRTIALIPHHTGKDGMVSWRGVGTRWCASHFNLEAAAAPNLPLLVPCPLQPYLQENFGDLRVSLQRFDPRLDGPNVEITDKDALVNAVFATLHDALARNDQPKIRRYRRQLRQFGEGRWLDRI